MISICAVPVFCDELLGVRYCPRNRIRHLSAYRITIIVLLRVYARTGRTIGRHRLISVLPEMEYVLLFIVVYALYYLWANERAFCYYSFQGYHVIEAVGAEGPRVAGEFSEATNVRAIIHLIRLFSGCRRCYGRKLTTSSEDSLAGLFGSATMIFLSA